MFEPTVCNSCSAPVAPGQAFCPRFGAALERSQTPAWPSVTEAAAGTLEDIAAVERAAPATVALDTGAGADPEDGAELPPEPAARDGEITSDRVLTPSATYRTLGSIGAARPLVAVSEPTRVRARCRHRARHRPGPRLRGHARSLASPARSSRRRCRLCRPSCP